MWPKGKAVERGKGRKRTFKSSPTPRPTDPPFPKRCLLFRHLPDTAEKEGEERGGKKREKEDGCSRKMMSKKKEKAIFIRWSRRRKVSHASISPTPNDDDELFFIFRCASLFSPPLSRFSYACSFLLCHFSTEEQVNATYLYPPKCVSVIIVVSIIKTALSLFHLIRSHFSLPRWKLQEKIGTKKTKPPFPPFVFASLRKFSKRKRRRLTHLLQSARRSERSITTNNFLPFCPKQQ